jgi:hypothetical protein
LTKRNLLLQICHLLIAVISFSIREKKAVFELKLKQNVRERSKIGTMFTVKLCQDQFELI